MFLFGQLPKVTGSGGTGRTASSRLTTRGGIPFGSSGSKQPLFSLTIDPRSLGVATRKLEAIRLFVENMRDNQGPMRDMGQHMLAIIKKRTLAGRDATGAPFKGLSTKRSAGEPTLEFLKKNANGDSVVVPSRTKRLDGQPFALRKGSSYAERKAAMIRTAAKRKTAAGTADVKTPPAGSVHPPKANLYLTGILFRSMQAWGSNKKGHLGVTVGVNRNKSLAALLQRGAGRLPARPFIGLTDKERRVVTNRFVKQFKTGLGKEILRTRRL